MTPLLIVALPKDQAPLVWWSSDTYVICASSRLDDPAPLGFDEAFARYAERHDEAHWFDSREAAQAWAEGYTGPNWLELRALVAQTEALSPDAVAMASD